VINNISGRLAMDFEWKRLLYHLIMMTKTAAVASIPILIAGGALVGNFESESPSRVYCLCCYSRHHNGPPNLFVEVKVYVESKKHGRKSYLELWDSLNWYPDPQNAVLHRTFPRCSYYVRLDLSLCQIFPLEMESAIWF
jgi:hypothetical protein